MKNEESKNSQKQLPKDPLQRNVLHLTDKNLIKRMDYDKLHSPLRGIEKTKKKREFKMTEEEKEINRKILYNMNLKLNFVKNPRYKELPNIEPYDTKNFKPIDSKENPFSVEPQEVFFQDYQPGNVYQIDVIILNRTSLLTSFKYVPPLTENFAIKEVIYPKKDSTLIAAGMHAKMKVMFHATSLENFQDEIVILTERMAFKIQLKAFRDKPTLSLANPMDCKHCFLGDRTEMHFLCKNNGGDAHFRFFPMESENEPNKETNNQNFNELLTVGPFTIFPQEFYLYKGMSQSISVSFSPTEEGIIEKKISLICENSTLVYVLKGEGIKVDIEIKKLDGLSVEDVSAQPTKENKILASNSNHLTTNLNGIEENEEFDEEEKLESNDIGDDTNHKLTTLFFSDTFPYTSTSRELVLQNTSSVSVKFHWTIYDMYHQNEFSIQPEENFFSIEPEDGVFGPQEEKSFTIKFTPINSVIYEQKLDLVIENIPFPAIKQFCSSSVNIKNIFTKAEPYLPGFNSSFPSYPLYSFTLSGKGKLPGLQINKTYIDLGDVYQGEEIKDSFEVFNQKTGKLKFKISQIIQKLITAKKGETGKYRFFNDRGLINEVIFKEKTKFSENPPEIIERDYQKEDERKTDYDFKEVDYLKIYKEENNKTNPTKDSQVTDKPSLNTTELTMKKLKAKKKNVAGSPESKKPITNATGGSPTSKTRKSIGSTSDNPVLTIPSTSERLCPIDEFIDLKEKQTFHFNFKFKGEDIGVFKSSVIFKLDDGKPFAIDIIANVIGPKLVVNTPLLDFEIFPISKVQKKQFEIENISPIPCHYLIKESRYKNIHINNYADFNYIQEFEGEFTEEEIAKKKNKINTILEYDTQYRDQYDIEKLDSYKLKFSSCYGELKPGEKKLIDVSFLSPYPIHIEKDCTVEVELENGETNYINLIAQCEEVEVYIQNTLIAPKDIFLTMPIKHENNTITIINPSNLPVKFKWDNVYEPDQRTAVFEPNYGVIQPHDKVEVNYKITYFTLTTIDDLYICKIEELDTPLGFVLQGTVTGLDISYEFTEETYEMIKELNKHAHGFSLAGSMQKHQTKRVSTRRQTRLSSTFNKDIESDPNRFKIRNITLANLKVNTPMELYFKIKNLSGIPTTFHLNVQNYPPGKEKIKSDKDQTSTVVTKLSTLSKRSKQQNQQGFKIDHPLLTAAHEEINFTSEKGAEFTKQKQIEKDSVLYLSNNKGIALILEPKKGRLKPRSEVTIKLSVFNECVGEFQDFLVSNVKGLATASFPVNLRIKGNPVQLSPFQPGINYLVEPQLMKVGSIIRGGEPISKRVRLVNIGTNTINIDWKIYDNEDIERPAKRNVFDIKIHEHRDKKFNLDFNINEPHEFPDDKKYFKIEPEHGVVGPKESIDFKITFHTNEEGEKLGMFIAYPRIEDAEGNTKIRFNELPLRVSGTGLIPSLNVDKRINAEGKYLYKFYVHSYGKHPKPKRSIILINKEKINMIVDVSLEGPFKIERSEPFEATLAKQKYNIIPNSNLKLDVKFIMPSPQNEKEWPMLLQVEKEGKLIVRFENGEIAEYYLKAILKRPRILLSFTGNKSVESSDTVDFGHVNCSCTKVEKMFLMNETDVDTNWKISYVKFKPKVVYGYGTVTEKEKEDQMMLDDPSVFNFEISDGVIYGPTDVLTDLPLGPALPKLDVYEERKYKPLTIKIMFSPTKNVFYKCRYRIETSTGNSIDFILKGNGSYLEEHII